MIELLVFLTVLVTGLICMAVVNAPHTAELERLAQHQKRLQVAGNAPASVFLSRQPGVNTKITRLLVIAGLDDQINRVRQQWIGVTIAGGVVPAGICLATVPSYALFALVMGTIFGAGGYMYYLIIKGNNRQKKLTRQLPQVLDSMANTLKAGSSIMDVFRTMSETTPEPIRTEFNRARAGFQFNKSLREVFAEMSERIISKDFKFLTQAVSISEQTGADLANIVASISETLRDRFKLRDMVSSITAQGKATAIFLGILPYAVGLLFGLANPTYMLPLIMNPVVRLVIICLAIWELIGIYILWKIVAYEV